MGILIVIEGLILVVVGLLGLQSRIVQRMPEATEAVERIARNQGWIGIVAAVWGFFDFIYALRWVPLLGAGLAILWISMFLGALLTLLLGVLYGYGMVQQRMLSRAKEETRERLDKVVARIHASQIPLGFVALFGGAWIVVYYVIISSAAFARTLG
jgi:predicted membrane channel-forming protein YqfA (hemolysin III family)